MAAANRAHPASWAGKHGKGPLCLGSLQLWELANKRGRNHSPGAAHGLSTSRGDTPSPAAAAPARHLLRLQAGLLSASAWCWGKCNPGEKCPNFPVPSAPSWGLYHQCCLITDFLAAAGSEHFTKFNCPVLANAPLCCPAAGSARCLPGVPQRRVASFQEICSCSKHFSWQTFLLLPHLNAHSQDIA